MCLLFQTSVCQSVFLAWINPLGVVLENLPETGGIALHLDPSMFSSDFLFSMISSPEKGQGNDKRVKQL